MLPSAAVVFYFTRLLCVTSTAQMLKLSHLAELTWPKLVPRSLHILSSHPPPPRWPPNWWGASWLSTKEGEAAFVLCVVVSEQEAQTSSAHHHLSAHLCSFSPFHPGGSSRCRRPPVQSSRMVSVHQGGRSSSFPPHKRGRAVAARRLAGLLSQHDLVSSRP